MLELHLHKLTYFNDYMQALSHKTLVMLLGIDPSKNPDQPIPATFPEVAFAYIKHMWKSDQKVKKLTRLSISPIDNIFSSDI